MSDLAATSDKQALSQLRDVHRRLETFASLCQAAEDAAAEGEVERLLDLAFGARQLRHAISTTQATKIAEPCAEAALLVAESRLASARAKPGDELLHKLHQRSLPDDAGLLASAVGIVALAEAMLPTTWNYEEDLVIFFGNGLDAPAEVLRRLGQERLCVYLPEGEELEYYSDAVLVVHSVEDLYKRLASWAPRQPKRIVSRSLHGGSISVQEQEEVIEAAQLYLGYVQVDRNTSDAFADLWIEQGIKNLPKIVECASVACFDKDFVGKPMVVVAPGPSLSKNIKELHKFKDKAIICTFSHTLSAFAAEGIDPDIVMTVDSNSLQYHFDDFPMTRVGAMVSGATVYPELFELPAPRHITMGANAAFDEWLARLLQENFLLPAGGSVSTSAFSLGLKWKCDPIIFVGLDLSFPGGRYYVETSCDGELTVTTSEHGELVFDGWSQGCLDMRERGGPVGADVQPSFELAGYHGGTVPTSQMFWLFHDWFEKKAKEVGDETTLLNCTEGGAYIEGMEHITLAEAYERYVESADPLEVGATLDERIDGLGAARRQRIQEGILDLIGSVERCLSLVGRCDRLAERAQSDSSLLDELSELETNLSDSLVACRFMSICKQHEIDLAFNRATAAHDVAELLSASRDLYGAVREAGLLVAPKLRRALDEINGKEAQQRSHG